VILSFLVVRQRFETNEAAINDTIDADIDVGIKAFINSPIASMNITSARLQIPS